MASKFGSTPGIPKNCMDTASDPNLDTVPRLTVLTSLRPGNQRMMLGALRLLGA